MISPTKKNIELISPLIYSDGMGGQEIITPPGLILLFNSETLCKQFMKDSKKQYTAKDIMDIIEKEFGHNKLKISVTTVKGYFDNSKFFNKIYSKKIVIGVRGLTSVCIAEFKPIARHVFEAVMAARKDLKK